MGLPRSLKYFATFVDGVNYVGDMPEVGLPKLTRKMEKYRSGGMSGEDQLDFGMEALEAELTAAAYMKDLFATWGERRVGGVMLRFAGSLESDDDESIEALEVILRGRFNEIDFGKAKAGDKTELKYKMAVAYYKLSLNGQVLIELEPRNMIEVINGVDRLAQTRAALGI